MIKTKNSTNPKVHVDSSPQSSLGRELIIEYLRDKGYCFEDLRKLPKEERKKIMKDACMYASLKLAEVEAKAGFRKKIRFEKP
jgi:hypothetical protein